MLDWLRPAFHDGRVAPASWIVSIVIRVLRCLVLLVSAGALARCLVAESPPKDGRNGKAAFFSERIGQQPLRDPRDRTKAFEFVKEPLFQYDNPVSRIADGFMFAWTEDGRPVAVMKSYYFPAARAWGRTYVSLATRRLELPISNTVDWTPEKPGLEFQPVEPELMVSDQARTRLIQMKDIAGKFKVVDNWGIKDPTDWELRLLPTPLYRYTAPKADVVDGAIFGYVLTTSPEALMVIEARKTSEGLRWYHGLARFTRFKVTFFDGDETVADFERLEAWPATGTYFHSRVPLPDYPFHNEPRADSESHSR